MKIAHKLSILFSLCITGLLVTGFYYNQADRHAATVLPLKMNVFYAGVDNPVEISACGIEAKDLHTSISNGTLTPGAQPGRYIVNVPGGTECIVKVSFKEGDEEKELGSFRYRVKWVPDPVAYVGNIKGDGDMSKATLTGLSGVFARMENFDFDMRSTVVSFELSSLVDGKWIASKANGPALTAEMKSQLANAQPGDKVLFQNITVKGPDELLRKIPGVAITVK